MKSIVTGVDAAGRSCVVEEQQIAPEAGPVMIHAIETTPPPPRPDGAGAHRDLGVAPGHVRWLVAHFPPGAGFDMHHTDTVDFDTVLAGSVHLVLDDGEHLLEAGDCAVVSGVDHAWRAGPDGCTLAVVVLGSEPPAGP